MTKRSKAYRAAAEKIQSGVLYTPAEAIHLAKSTSITKFDATVDVVFRLGVDPRKADQMVRGTVSLPHGTGKTALNRHGARLSGIGLSLCGMRFHKAQGSDLNIRAERRIGRHQLNTRTQLAQRLNHERRIARM